VEYLDQCMSVFVETSKLYVPLVSLFLPEKWRFAVFVLGYEHSQSYKMHRTMVARQGDNNVSVIQSLEAA
jgi:hypothetical protein